MSIKDLYLFPSEFNYHFPSSSFLSAWHMGCMSLEIAGVSVLEGVVSEVWAIMNGFMFRKQCGICSAIRLHWD